MKRKLSFLAMAAVCCAVAMAQEPAVSGDVNGDGVCNLNDITALYNYLLNDDDSGLVNGDQNGDGIITVCDVTWVYNILLNLPQDEHEWVDLGLPSGTLWATMNVGANSPEEYGDYFAWGETTPKDYYDWSTYKWCNGSNNTLTKYCIQSNYGYNGFVDNKTELDPEDDAAYVNWGPEWRMPSYEQIEELLNNCSSQWTRLNGVNGRLFTGSSGESLFLPDAGLFDGGENSASGAYWWSRTLMNSTYSTYYYYTYNAYGCFTYSGYNIFNSYSRCKGLIVRAVRVP